MELVTTFDNCGAALSVRQDSTRQRVKVKVFFIAKKTWGCCANEAFNFNSGDVLWSKARLERSRREVSESFMLDADGIRSVLCENNT